MTTEPRATQVGRTFAAQVNGIDLRRPLDSATKEWIEQALGQFGVLSFGPQQIDDDLQHAFIEHFGPPFETTMREATSGHRHFYDITNVDEAGQKLDPASTRAMVLLGNFIWHTDGSQAQPPTRLSALHARQLPSNPPPTEYADMRAAWDALSPSRQKELEGLQIVHDFFWSRLQIGMKMEDFSEQTLQSRPNVTHPLVRTHPVTGRKSLYLASHASHPVGWPVQEGRAFMKELIAHATQPQFVYSHEWVPHEVVMWDDRWTMHRATHYEGGEARKMRWCGARETAPV
jgi:alpha-ketoglutarate-dependent 2,4-dichlorophenoxyacetate dioxygenase